MCITSAAGEKQRVEETAPSPAVLHHQSACRHRPQRPARGCRSSAAARPGYRRGTLGRSTKANLLCGSGGREHPEIPAGGVWGLPGCGMVRGRQDGEGKAGRLARTMAPPLQPSRSRLPSPTQLPDRTTPSRHEACTRLRRLPLRIVYRCFLRIPRQHQDQNGQGSENTAVETSPQPPDQR